MGSVRDCAIFRSDAFALDWPGGDEKAPPPWGRDLAVFLMRGLAEKGATGEEDEPFEDSTGQWVFWFSLADVPYVAFVQWAPIEPEHDDTWLVHVGVSRGFLGLLMFWRRRRWEEQIGVARELVDTVLQEAAVRELRWLNTEELAAIY